MKTYVKTVVSFFAGNGKGRYCKNQIDVQI